MQNFFSLWDYEEVESVDELKQKLTYTSLQLESLKQEKMELLNHLKISNQERDEAKDQLLILLNNLLSPSPIQLPMSPSQVQWGSHALPIKANSSITESNSLSHVSSPVDFFIDVVSSPDFSSINVVDSNKLGYVGQPLVQDCNWSASLPLVSVQKPKPDRADVLIDALVKGKPLPEKGKFVQAVKDAGPLLHTLVLAGPLPRWRNPPPAQPIKVPPFTIKDFDTPVSSPIRAAAISCCPPQTSSTSTLNFAGSLPGPLTNAWQRASNASVKNQVHSSKRQRHQYF